MKNQNVSIRNMVRSLNNEEENGGFWLPKIQRSFVWSEDQIERLFDSIMREYPISTFLVWKTKSGILRRKFIDNYASNSRLNQLYVPSDEKIKLLVLDGQQRLQSLFIGLCGSYEWGELHFDILSGDLVAPDDVRYKFRFEDSSKAEFPLIKFKDIVFNYESNNRIAKSIIKNAGRELTEDEETRIEDNIARIQKQFVISELLTYQLIDSVENPEVYSEEDVVEIFIRANSGGTHLSKSDLLFSLLSSDWDDAYRRIDELLHSLNGNEYSFTRDFILKTCLTLLNKGAEYNVQKFRDNNTRGDLIDKWDDIANAIKDVRDYLYGKTFLRTHKAIPSYLALIPIIYFRYHYPEKWKDIRNLDEYLLRTLISGAFNSRPDNIINRCSVLISKTEEFDIENIFKIIRDDGRILEVKEENILGLKYGSKNIHLIFNLWYRNFNYTPAYESNFPQVDHIFPQALLKSVKQVNPDTGRNKLKYYQNERDQFANLMLLTAKENGTSRKGNKPPNEWFADKDEAYLDMHLIPKNPELWELEKYDEFIEARKKLILEKFGYMVQGYKSE